MEKLNNTEFKSLFNTELDYLFNVFEKYKYELRIAGGAVRDLLMNIKPKDIDLATNATPEQMKEIFEKENLRTLNRNGEKHGTVTVRINNENFEITTLRIDVKTDGRHAEVQFTNDWKLDSNRRDLTINSIFLGEDGTIYDYFNGAEDLQNRYVRFVGEPNERVREDYLRILRYFRFYGRISVNDYSHDKAAIEAIRNNANGLQNIHGERIWIELRKILVGNFADSIMSLMVELNVNKYIGLPDNPNINEFSNVYKRYKLVNKKYEINPVTMVCALLDNIEHLDVFSKRVRFSNEERKLAEFILEYRKCDEINENEWDYLRPYKNILVDSHKDCKIYERLRELLLYQGHIDYLESIENWKVPIFPINGDTLLKKGLHKGPIFSKVLTELKDIWKNQYRFEVSEDELLRISKILIEKYKK